MTLATIPAQAQRLVGLDVSAWQGNISAANWATLKRATNQQVSGTFGDGRDFVFIRSSRGGTTGEDHRSGGYPAGENTFTNLSQRYDDPYFGQNITRATTAGMLAGPYHFGRPDIIESTGNSGGIANNGTDEANHMIQMAGPWMRPGYLLPVFDLEAGQGLRTSTQLSTFAVQFSDRIYAVMGFRPMVYSGQNYANFIDATVPIAFPNLWLARWPNQPWDTIDVQNLNPPPSPSTANVYGKWNPNFTVSNPYPDGHPWKFWQYSSSGHLNGIGNAGPNVDVDVAHGGIEFIKDYLVPALWMSNTNGLWSTLSNWNSGQTPVAPVQAPGQVTPIGTTTLPTPRLPGIDDTVILDRPNNNVTITFGSGAHNIRKLYVRETLQITNGSLVINYVPSPDSTPISAQLSAPVTLSGGSINVHTLQVDGTRTFTLAGGAIGFNVISLMPHSTTPAKIAIIDDVTLNPRAGGTGMIGKGFGSGASGFVDLGSGVRSLNIGNGVSDVDVSIEVSITNGGLIKTGAGTLRLTGVNNYTGGTTISSGKLVVNNAAGSATGIGTVTVQGGILTGTGTIGGPVNVLPGGTLSPGASVGILSINNSLALAGTTVMELNAVTNDFIRGITSLTYGGTLILSNAAGALTTSNSFKLFNANSYSGAFSAIVPATPGPNLAWNTNTLTIDGTLRVLSTAPVTIAASVSDNVFGFSWPADHTGWRLQVQTNSIAVGLSTNWVDVPNSCLTNQVGFTIDPAVGCAFYRVVYP